MLDGWRTVEQLIYHISMVTKTMEGHPIRLTWTNHQLLSKVNSEKSYGTTSYTLFLPLPHAHHLLCLCASWVGGGGEEGIYIKVCIYICGSGGVGFRRKTMFIINCCPNESISGQLDSVIHQN